MSALTVSELAIYPVKSLGALAMSRLRFDSFGPAGDRRYVVVNRAGRFVTQREYPRMTLIQIALNARTLEFSAPTMLAFSLAVSSVDDGSRDEIVVWRDRVAARDMGDAIAAWLSAYLETELRLYYMPDDSARAVDPAYGKAGDRVSFADGFPVLLLGAASLAEFNRALPEPIESLRFRPNIVVAGAEPYAEDAWRRVLIGALEFDVVKPCSRCVIPSIDPRTAQKQPLVAQTLARLRRRDNAVYFGQNLIARGVGEVALGDAVTVID